MNTDKLTFNNRILKHFIDDSLGLLPGQQIDGFYLVDPLLEAAAYNTYLETVSDKADTLYLRIKESITEMTTHSYLDYVRRLSEKFEWKKKEIVLAFDYTDEDFYGDVQGFDIHGWTGKSGVSGKFKFLTCSMVSDEIPQKIPLISIPIALGHYKSYAITHCLELIKPFIGAIRLILFDRGFYDKDLMYELSRGKYPYLIFVPKGLDKKEILFTLEKDDHIVIVHDYTVNKDKSKYQGETYMAFLKQIYCKNADKEFDWVFATNVEEVALGNIIIEYKKRWRIETAFRVQDEARIKCKSTEMKIRYFLFMFEQMLQTVWVCFYKDEVSFKKFLIEMHEVATELVKKPKAGYGKS